MKNQNNISSIFSDLRFYAKESKRMFDGMLESKRRITDEPDQPGNKENVYKSGISQYSVRGDRFLPIGDTVKSLPAGWYNFVYDPGVGCMLPQLRNIRNDELIKLPMPAYDQVLLDMKKFWDSEDDYRRFKFAYKRGIILYGQQGTGKSGLINIVSMDLINNQNGVIFDLASPDDIFTFERVFNDLREIEPKRRVICIMEDIDNFIRYGGSCVSKLLNILDGNMRFDNVVFLSTTNFPDILLSSLFNRPSRFAGKYEVGLPSSDARKMYVKSKFKALSEEEVNKIVTASDGFTIDMLKELVLEVYVLKYDFEESVQNIKKLFSYNRTGAGYDSVMDQELIDGLHQLEITDREEFNKEFENN